MADGMMTESGRSIEISQNREEITITSPSGVVELRIKLTKDGPVLVATGPLKLEVPELLQVQAKALEVRTEGDMRFLAGGDVVMEGKMIHLN